MLQGYNFFENDSELAKTSFSVFVTILYIKVLYILVMILEPSNQSWCLSKEDTQIFMNKDVIGHLRKHDILAINFLYQNFKNKFKGAILNETNGFDMQNQVSSFLQIMFSSWTRPKENFLVLVITPECFLPKWNEKLKTISGLNVKVVDSNTCPEDFDQEHGLAMLLSFDDIKFAEILSEYHLASVIIDCFDTIANKLIVKKLEGNFNVGLTRRNFYTDPDQKLQWTMLNWAQPGSVGRLMDFYEVDNANFANLRESYHQWWLTLTWDYCETFEKNSNDSEDESTVIVKPKRKYSRRNLPTKKIKTDRSKENSIKESNSFEEIKPSEQENETVEKFNEDERIQNNKSKTDGDKLKFSRIATKSDDCCGEESENVVEHHVDFPIETQNNLSLDTSIVDNTISDKLDDDDNILLDIIQGVKQRSSSGTSDPQSQIVLMKEELYSQIFDDVPEFRRLSDSSEDILQSLIN